MTNWLEGMITAKRQWNERLFSLRFDARLGEFRAGQFVRLAQEIDGELIARPYSLINSPAEDYQEIYFNIVPDGPLTPRLAALQRGDRVLVAEKPAGLLTVESISEVPHLWLLATGTGVGPFLSILKTASTWQRFDKVVLAYSVRTSDELSYLDTITQVQKQHPEQFCFVPFVTREALQGAVRARISAAIQDGFLEAHTGLRLEPSASHVMLCGNSAMITDVVALLEGRGLRRHSRREPGHISLEKYH